MDWANIICSLYDFNISVDVVVRINSTDEVPLHARSVFCCTGGMGYGA
jgi:hypothetical protein